MKVLVVYLSVELGLAHLRRSCNSLTAAQFVLWKRTLKRRINTQHNVLATVEGAGRIYSILTISLKTKVATFIETE